MREIFVIGNRHLNRTSVVSLTGLKTGEKLNQTDLDAAARRLRESGLFGGGLPNSGDGVKISAEIRDGAARIVIVVKENGLVDGFDIRGSGPIPAGEVLKLLEPLKNQLLNLRDVQRKVGEIRQIYEDRGYSGFVTEELALKDGILLVPIAVGRIGGIHIVGLDSDVAASILSLLRTQPHSYFNVRDLRRDLKWLKSMGIETLVPLDEMPMRGPVRRLNDLVLELKPPGIREEPMIREIRVVGAREISREAIIEASGLQVGQRFDTSRLAEARRNVAALGYFGFIRKERIGRGPDRP